MRAAGTRSATVIVTKFGQRAIDARRGDPGQPFDRARGRAGVEQPDVASARQRRRADDIARGRAMRAIHRHIAQSEARIGGEQHPAVRQTGRDRCG